VREAINGQTPSIYRLDEIEIDVAKACVRRNGEERHVRQKTFHVLVYLLEHRERLISRTELIENIWRGTAVTDNALEQCLAEIRRALGDDSRQPRFVKTVPRAGYRFIGAVQEPAAEAASLTADISPATVRSLEERPGIQASGAANPSITGDSRPRSQRRSRLILVSILGLVIIAAAIAAWWVKRHRSPFRSNTPVTLSASTGKRSVVVLYFDNQSGDTDLDWLREGLADMIITELSRSQNLTVLSRQQLRILLDRIGHNEPAKIRLDEALDIAQKSQANLFVLGSFARLGNQIRIDAQLHDASNGELLAAERLVVDQPEKILTQVDLLSLKLASHLGGLLQPEANVGLTNAMTNSLEAYRYYSLGVEKAEALQNSEAVALLEKAVEIDPAFAMAYARLGYVYSVTWSSQDRGKPFLEKAFQLSDRLTEKDKLYITGWYAIANFDYAAAIKSFRDIVARYPFEVEAYRRLGLLLRGEERFDESIEVMKQGLVIDSGAQDLYNSLGSIYSDTGRHDEALSMLRRYVQLAPREPNAHDSLAIGLQWAGQYDDAVQEYNRALALKPDFDIAVIHLGNTFFEQGRYREAIEQYQRQIEISPSLPERSRGFGSISYVQLKAGRLAEAERNARQAVKYHKGALAQLFMVALEKGDLAAARVLEKGLDESRFTERGIRFSLRPYLYFHGLLDLETGRSLEAIDDFKAALSHRPQTWTADAFEDCLANAYLKLGRLDEAIAEYERILKLNPNYPLVHFHLAQAYERKGQADQARAEYERFLQVWKDADADIPEVIAAKRALARKV
jgi:tetratricopeptide (TPR) repeat protein/DNA-binding winged helix-turn-helix (wHTH) protein